jgi:hypothetical protein
MPISYNRAKAALNRIKANSSKCLAIHYACQSLYDNKEGLSPRIADIVVKSFTNDQTVSFAVHITAEQLRINRDDIDANFDKIEAQMLEDFFSFVRDHRDSLWLHWNMINIQYGFETIAHRYTVQTGKAAPTIDIDNRINIADMLVGLYGADYVPLPHIEKLMALNGGVRNDFVSGVDEVKLFKEKEYLRLHASTVRKVRFFCEVIELVIDRRLRTSRKNFYIRFESALDSVAAKTLAIFAALITIAGVLWGFFH